jgi:hypothetical protein
LPFGSAWSTGTSSVPHWCPPPQSRQVMALPAGAVVVLRCPDDDVPVEAFGVLPGTGELPGTDVLHDASHNRATDAATRPARRPRYRAGTDGGVEVRRGVNKTCEATDMTAELTDTWLIGVVAHGESLAGVRVHGGWVAAGPASGRPVRVHVRLRSAGDEASRFPDPATAEALLEAEAVIVDALGDEAVLVAVLTVPGFRDLELHADDGPASQAAIEALEPGTVGFPLTIDVDEDPAWSRYRALFADAVPADADRRQILDAAREADDGSPEREIAHRFRFPTLQEADRAAAALRATGVAVTFEEPDDANAEAAPRFEAREVETLTQAEMARSRAALSEFAASWDGDYEGWSLADR